MKATLSLRSAIQDKTQSVLTRANKTRSLLLPVLTRRLLLLTLVSLVAVAALLSIAALANKANRAAKAREAQAANAKGAINPVNQESTGKQPAVPLSPTITATLTDNIPAATKVAPGGTINYTAVITNTGVSPTDDATNLNFSDTLDSNTTLTAGSIHASPLAFNDTYNWVGNTFLDTVARALPAVTANDVAVNAPGGTDTFTLTTIAGGATTLGGTVTLAANGSFTYTPPLGQPIGASATDTFTYTITNNADGTLTGTGTVNIVLTGRVWYLQAGAAGDGRSNTPSGSPSAMSTAADKTTDIFYIFSGGVGNLNGLFSLDNSQQLLGQGVNLVVNAITLFTATSNPTTTDTTGNGVTLANGNTLRGFDIGNCSGTAISGAASVGTLTINTLSINTTGAGLDLTGTGNPVVSVVLGGLTSTGGTKNVNLVSLGGTITLASGALSGATGNAFDVNGGVATITYSGTINNSGAKQVNIANMTGGSVALNGAVGGTGTGINLTTNTGATISFTGGIALSTGANPAFTATGPGPAATSGGTVNVTQNNTTIVNTLTTTTGTALNMANTTIGASGLTFRSIASNGSASGIVLNNTGASGGLTVSGDTGSANNSSGGTIQNTTSHGISLATTQNVSLDQMNIQSTGGSGINGTTVTNFTFTNGTINNSGNALGESNIAFNGSGALTGNNIAGTLTVTNSTLTNAFDSGLDVQSNDGTISNATVTGNTITSSTSTATSKGTGINFVGTGTATTVHSLTKATISGNSVMNFPSNAGIQVNYGNVNAAGPLATAGIPNDATNIISIINNPTIKGNSAANRFGTSAIILSMNGGNSGQRGRMNFDVSGNGSVGIPIGDSLGTVVLIGNNGYATMTGTVNNNVIVANNTVASNGIGGGNGIVASSAETPDLTLTVSGNTISQVDGNGILLVGRGVTGLAKLSIKNNTVAAPLTGLRPGIRVDAGNASSVDDAVCVDISGNTTAGSGNVAGIGLRKQGTVTTTNDFSVEGMAATSSPGVEQFVGNGAGKNPGSANGVGDGSVNGVLLISATSGFSNCASAPIPPPDNGGIATTLSPQRVENPVNDSVVKQTETSNSAVSSASPSTFAWLNEALHPVAPFAAKLDFLHSNNTPVTTNAIASKTEANGRTRNSKPEPRNSTVRNLSLSHHVVRSNLNVSPSVPSAPLSGEVVSLNTITTFPAGKSITIKYAATVNTPPLARQVSTQGTVSGGNFASVLTDDPDVVGTNQPTVTLVDTLATWNGGTSTDWNTASNWTVPGPGPAYAPGVSNPAVNDVVIPNVGAQPNIGTTDITVFSLNISNGRTLAITNPRVLTIGAPAAGVGGDLTLDGIISGGFLNFGTGSHNITNAGGTGSLSSTNVATVLSGGTVTLNDNLQAGALAVNAGAPMGSMNITNRTLSLNGSGAALINGGTFTITGSTVALNGSAAQTIAGTTYNNLTINNSIGTNITGVTLTGNATVNGLLTLTSSDLATGAFTLTMPNTATSGPATNATDVVGNVKRTGFASGGIALSFGNAFNTIRINSGAAPADITVNLAKSAPADFSSAVQRTYTITPNGANGPATLRLHYLDTELNGNTPETNLNLRRFNGTGWAPVIPTSSNTADATNNWLENNAVSTFSPWTFSTFTPTATGGVITGRIVDSNGNAVEGAVVRLAGTQNRKFITDANGFYRFENVETGGFYTVTPSRANYSFSPSVRSFSQIGETTEAVFNATLASGNFVNPLDTPEYFVRQHYVDFLGREPDEAGFNFWSDQILSCGSDAACVERRTINVSAAYFLSIEFQETGGLVDGLYRAGYGVRPNFAEFMPDTRTVAQGVVVNRDGWQTLLEANKQAFVTAFVNRPAFHAMYDGMDNNLFVDTLISHTGVSFTAGERDALVGGLTTGTSTRADVLRSIAENRSFITAKFNDAFVMMEYFGYLRRDADADGFAFWLNKLNQFGGNFEQAEMVKAFIVSGEYRDRFPW